jgi:hypothetical protein
LTFLELRKLAADYMRQYKNDFMPFLEDIHSGKCYHFMLDRRGVWRLLWQGWKDGWMGIPFRSNIQKLIGRFKH